MGLDTFDGGSYPISNGPDWKPIECETEEEILVHAKAQMDSLKKLQPDSSSGGQDFGGIQDRIFVLRPDGSSYRYFG